MASSSSVAATALQIRDVVNHLSLVGGAETAGVLAALNRSLREMVMKPERAAPAVRNLPETITRWSIPYGRYAPYEGAYTTQKAYRLPYYDACRSAHCLSLPPHTIERRNKFMEREGNLWRDACRTACR